LLLQWMDKTWRPHGNFADILDVPFEDLHAAGYRLIMLDIDNTLVPHGSDQPDARACGSVARIAAAGLSCIVVSNAGSSRSRRFSDRLGVECLAYAGKPSPRGVLEACRRKQVDPSRAALIGDQLFTDMAAARRAGSAAIRVSPISPHEPPHVRLKRLFERLLARRYRLAATYLDLPLHKDGVG